MMLSDCYLNIFLHREKTQYLISFDCFSTFALSDLTDATCYEKGFSAYYSGKVNITQSGILCARWDSDEFYQDFSEEENYCRDLDGAGFPWCLSSAPGVRWERCNIYTCSKLFHFHISS